MQIKPIPLLKDNYAYAVWGDTFAAVIDPSESAGVLKFFAHVGRKVTHILNTHHHWDHVGGNLAIKGATGAKIYGGDPRIPGIDVTLSEGDPLVLGGATFEVISVPGHTRGHTAFYLRSAGAVFSGDTLFSLGCGRLFEGSPAQMVNSLAKLKQLPPETLLYCGHEYTLANARFAGQVDPTNVPLAARTAEVFRQVREGLPTVGITLATELATNPFLRCTEPAILEFLKLEDPTEINAFAALRERKDMFPS